MFHKMSQKALLCLFQGFCHFRFLCLRLCFWMNFQGFLYSEKVFSLLKLQEFLSEFAKWRAWCLSQYLNLINSKAWMLHHNCFWSWCGSWIFHLSPNQFSLDVSQFESSRKSLIISGYYPPSYQYSAEWHRLYRRWRMLPELGQAYISSSRLGFGTWGPSVAAEIRALWRPWWTGAGATRLGWLYRTSRRSLYDLTMELYHWYSYSCPLSIVYRLLPLFGLMPLLGRKIWHSSNGRSGPPTSECTCSFSITQRNPISNPKMVSQTCRQDVRLDRL